MDELGPGVAEDFRLEVSIEILHALLVCPVQLAIGTCSPDLKRNDFSEQMESVGRV